MQSSKFTKIDEEFNEEIKEAKYFKGEICPRCYENHIIKYGKRYDRQRFKCKKCGAIRKNKAAEDDNMDKIIELSSKH